MGNTDFFSGRSSYRCALANLLLSLGDKQTAKKVFENYPKHPLVNKDLSLYAFLATRVLSELTEDRYQGIMSLNPFSLNLSIEAQTKMYYDDKITDKILRIIKEEEQLGRICSRQEIAISHPPALIAIVEDSSRVFDWRGSAKFVPKNTLPTGHGWIVGLGKGEYIYGNKVVSYKPKDLSVRALLDVYRT